LIQSEIIPWSIVSVNRGMRTLTAMNLSLLR
jgi:hypothetical protein